MKKIAAAFATLIVLAAGTAYATEPTRPRCPTSDPCCDRLANMPCPPSEAFFK